jgi:superfamily II DNA/RNA helicase
MWSRDAFSSSDLSHLITTSIGAEGNNWRDLDNLIVVNIPSEKLIAFEGEREGVINSYKGVIHYLVEAVGRVGCSGREGQVKIYYDPKTEAYARKDLIKLLKFTKMPVPDFLEDGCHDE